MVLVMARRAGHDCFLKVLVSRTCQILNVRFYDSGARCASALLPLGVSDNSCSSRFLSALVASLQAAMCVQRVFRDRRLVELFASHVEAMSNFQTPRPFFDMGYQE
jgi:hypothetical protein